MTLTIQTSLKKKQDILDVYQQEYIKIDELLKHIQKSRGLFEDPDDDNISSAKDTHEEKKPVRLFPILKQRHFKARTVAELQEKLKILKGTPKLPYKERMLKKGLKNKLKKKEKRRILKVVKRSKQIKTPVQTLTVESPSMKMTKPIYNNDGKMVFNKFYFSESNLKDEKKKTMNDPLAVLKKLTEKQEKIKELENFGKIDVVAGIKTKDAWKNALLKSDGIKIKDDTVLLRKSIKRHEELKKKSKNKWKLREEKLIKDVNERQKKRSENIQARSKQKQLNKLKKAAKKGRIIAGF